MKRWELPRRVAASREPIRSRHTLVQVIRIRFRSMMFQATIPHEIPDIGEIRTPRLEGPTPEAKFSRISENDL